ncbi:MAG: hypothetical protein KBC64_00825 [Simkaniaceae bacterium]|nr:hypothetical protein [Simkaniaceae bacterium]
MDIFDGESYFQEGTIVDILHKGDKILLSLKSVELEEDEVEDDIELGEDHTLLATLCLEGVAGIYVDDEPFEGILTKIYDLGTIVELEFFENGIELQVHWVNFPPKKEMNTLSLIEIEADKVYFLP